jgi:SAM-dependent methyltransferase
MDRSLLVRLLGFPANLIHHDLLVLDRWLWLRRRLPRTRNGERLIDIGCGTGSFTIGAARRGYIGVGLSWDLRNQQVAAERAALCKANLVEFPIQDIRELDKCTEFRQAFEIAICCENIEHILDDRKLMRDIHACLKPGGMLLLTTPNYFYRAITSTDNGPFSRIEDGWHVRRGYTVAGLQELCTDCSFLVEEISSCSGFLSQKITAVLRVLGRRWPLLAWATVLPLRPLPLLLDRLFARLTGWPDYSICLVAIKPRFNGSRINPGSL